MARNSHHRQRTIGWFNWRAVPGTVYLMQPRSRPDLFKIGYTSRPAETRRRELEKKSDRGLQIICAVTMPHAYALEQKLLGRMRGGWWIFRRRRNRRGTEWFHLRKGERIERIRDLVLWEACRTRTSAVLRMSWPILAGLQVFSPANEVSRPRGAQARRATTAVRSRCPMRGAGSRSPRR